MKRNFRLWATYFFWLFQYTNLKILSKIQKKATDQDIKRSLELVGLANVGKTKVKEFSLGMKQKLAIAQAIFEKPKLLLLDEPTNALDEKSVENIRKLLIEIKKTGTTIVIASHNKDDINMLSDIVLKMDEGVLTEQG